MTTLLVILLIVVSFVLVTAILLQSGKGGGMAASFGGVSYSPDAFIGARQAGNLLTKVTWWSGGIFLAIAFILQIASVRTRAPKSVLDQGLTPPPTAPSSAPPTSQAPALPFLPGQSAPAGGGAAPGGAPAPPPTPAATAPAPTAPAAPKATAPAKK